MFERFTERARQVVVLAQAESREMKHNYIGTEHILLGLIGESEGMAAHVLESFDLGADDLRKQILEASPGGEQVLSGQIPFTPICKKALELALREALSLGHNYIGTEHILLGMIRGGDGLAVRLLEDNAEGGTDEVRATIVKLLGTTAQRAPKKAPADTYTTRIRCANCGTMNVLTIPKGVLVRHHIETDTGIECTTCGCKLKYEGGR